MSGRSRSDSRWYRQTERRRAIPSPCARRTAAKPAGGRPASSYASGPAARNASTSAGDGGRPARSRLRRRIKVVSSASGERSKPLGFELARARIGRSGSWPSCALRTGGGLGRAIGSNAQCLFQRAPWSIHLLEELDLRGVSFLPDFGGGITSSGSVLDDAKKQLALAALARHDDRVFGPQRRLLDVEPQVGLSRLRVGPVAGEAVLREDRQDVAAEIDRSAVAPAMAAARESASHRGHRQQCGSTAGNASAVAGPGRSRDRRFRLHACGMARSEGGFDGGGTTCLPLSPLGQSHQSEF